MIEIKDEDLRQIEEEIDQYQQDIQDKDSEIEALKHNVDMLQQMLSSKDQATNVNSSHQASAAEHAVAVEFQALKAEYEGLKQELEQEKAENQQAEQTSDISAPFVHHAPKLSLPSLPASPMDAGSLQFLPAFLKAD